MFISKNIKIYLLRTYCMSILWNIFKQRVLVYLQIQMKFAMCGKPVNVDRST